MLEFFEQGVDLDEIAGEYDCSPSKVRLILKELGVTFGKIGRPSVIDAMDAASLEALIIEYTTTTINVRELCNKWKMDVTTFYVVLREMNVATRTTQPARVQARKDRMDLAMSMYQNHSIYVWQITAETGFDSVAIIQEVHRRGIPMRRGSQVHRMG
jgi:hypothetical protein